MTRSIVALCAALLAGCSERLMHMEYGVAIRDACPPGSYEVGNMCASTAATSFVSLVISATISIWVILTLRRIDAACDRIEKLAKLAAEKSADE
jgi:hypothetical protein